MRQAVCAVLTLIMAGPAMPQATADSSAYPSRVHHRSGLELAGAAPGALVYLPAQLVGYGARQTARLLYEERTIYRLKQALTFADGRVGVRPLAGSLNGMGARMFIHQIAGRVDVDLTSTLGASGRTRQNHLLTISSGGPRVFSAYYRSEPKEAFYGVGNDLAEADKTNFRQRDIYLQVTSRRSLAERVFLDWDANWHRTEIEAGGSDSSPSTTDVYSPDTLPGLADKID
ncbi:MAG: hypothetical protein HOH74_15080, partial [Gemmatimonadetes bacterium]|nr:hypothetical protein [Gemmatimonadota bacterium]